MRGVKDSLITFSAVGAAGLLAHYSLSNPTTIDHPKSLQKRYVEEHYEDYGGYDYSASQFFTDFCFDNLDECEAVDGEIYEDDVAMFQEADDDSDSENPDLDGRSRRKKKKKPGNPGAANNALEAANWAKTSEGKDAITKKADQLTKQVDKILAQVKPAGLADLPPDAKDIALGSFELSSTTNDVFVELEGRSGINCGYNADERLRAAHVFAIFPEDITYDADVDQAKLHNAYVSFGRSLNNYVRGAASYSIGTYSSNNVVTMNPYQASWFQNDFPRLNVPAKKNRQGSFNLGASMPSMGKLSTNIWKKVQKSVKRAADSTPGTTTCQIFMFMHNLPLEFKQITQGTFQFPANLLSRCNIVPITIGEGSLNSAFEAITANWDGDLFQQYTAVEPGLRGYINTDADNFSVHSNFIANALTSYSCLAEARTTCLIQKQHWTEPIEDLGAFKSVSTTAAFDGTTTTTEMTTTSALGTTTEGTTTDYTTTEAVPADQRCCGKINAGIKYDSSSAGCEQNVDGTYSVASFN
jgi:hypothetical protein